MVSVGLDNRVGVAVLIVKERMAFCDSGKLIRLGNLRLIIEEEGGFQVWCLASRGRHPQGGTKEEALVNIRETMALHLDSVQDERKGELCGVAIRGD